jgi:signal transduction histidine kinase/CheY-like chemotaxis protein/CHASE3 domain sensor protein
MHSSQSGTALARELSMDKRTAFALTAVIAFFVVSGLIAFLNIRTIKEDNQKVVHSQETITAIDGLLSSAQDAETGQRGFLLTGNERYLEPYRAALATVPSRVETITQLTIDNPSQQARIKVLRGFLDDKLAELKETIDLRRTKGIDAALAVVTTDRGKAAMDSVRAQLTAMQDEELALREKRLQEMATAYSTALTTGILSGLVGIILTILVGVLVRNASRIRRREAWLQAGQLELATAMLGDPETERLGESILDFLARFLDAQAGALFVQLGNHYRRIGTYGVAEGEKIVERFSPREGLLGQAVVEAKTVILADVPDGYLVVGSALGKSKPKHLIISPAVADGDVNAVVELGFLRPVGDDVLALLEQASSSIGAALRSAKYRAELRNLLEETQRQSEVLQVQGEELRVSNEELEEQSRALKESQYRLEQQQVELEQTNSQLEEQAQQLERQRDDLARANVDVEHKAREVEQASRYKSDFLANMSHELRTPLNSSLILAKLLADNPNENLTEEQVKYAQTIQSSGNDLLTLINDILDLSKIEAGHVEIRPESVSVERLVNEVVSLFKPIADQKGLTLEASISPNCPGTIRTDRQRLEQILKNLLSNACKFTEAGGVGLRVHSVESDKIAFSVSDSGIGISQEQQHRVFEAFRQADSTISRKYGGTGLGLSISLELSRLLGGGLYLESTIGQGSTFTVVVPEQFASAAVMPRNTSFRTDVLPAAPPIPTNAIKKSAPARLPDDDRNDLAGQKKVLLVVEDDASFAKIVRDLAHELDFKCLVATDAADALNLAQRYLPSAVVLDVGLPDQSGLSVLDLLKRDVRTRHIPIHVVSASDHAHAALSLGAIGYLLKPVKREQLADVLGKLEARLSQSIRRVLIVEDDNVQREAIRKLLTSSDVETVGAGTAAECLSHLKEHTFDCMVLDLSLSDASGFSLLEKLSEEGSYAFPPVIVYTGRDLSSDEEQRLRRYSASIIIKGAKSPERLLDEVTLFRHRVVSDLPAEQQKMIQKSRNRDAVLEGRRILIVEDDVRNVYALVNILEPHGASVVIARNGQESLDALNDAEEAGNQKIDLVLMDVMMPVMDGLSAMREIRKDVRWTKLPVIALTAKAMPDDQEICLQAGANDYMAKPLDVDRLLSLVRVWLSR